MGRLSRRRWRRRRRTHHPSPITHHPSPITHHSSLLTPHPSPITHHPSSPITLTHHPSPITHHSSLLTPQVPAADKRAELLAALGLQPAAAAAPAVAEQLPGIDLVYADLQARQIQLQCEMRFAESRKRQRLEHASEEVELSLAVARQHYFQMPRVSAGLQHRERKTALRGHGAFMCKCYCPPEPLVSLAPPCCMLLIPRPSPLACPSPTCCILSQQNGLSALMGPPLFCCWPLPPPPLALSGARGSGAAQGASAQGALAQGASARVTAVQQQGMGREPGAGCDKVRHGGGSSGAGAMAGAGRDRGTAAAVRQRHGSGVSVKEARKRTSAEYLTCVINCAQRETLVVISFSFLDDTFTTK